MILVWLSKKRDAFVYEIDARFRSILGSNGVFFVAIRWETDGFLLSISYQNGSDLLPML